MDVLTPAQRQKNMKSIRARGTKPERILGRGLHARGFRYRLNVPRLPGTPDLVFPRYHAVIFAHGCFWHGHNCCRFRIPATRRDFWLNKIEANRARDERNISTLLSKGWRVMLVWECALRGRCRHTSDSVLDQCKWFLESDILMSELAGIPEQNC